MILLNDQNFCMTSTQEVKELCSPLFASSKVNYFYFSRFFPDGTCFCLNTHPDWVKFFYNNKERLYPTEEYLAKVPEIFYEFFDNYDNETSSIAANNFGLNNYFTIYIKQKEYCDLFGFALEEGGSDFYLNNLRALKKFVVYFLERGSKLINQAQEQNNRLVLPEYLKDRDLVREKKIFVRDFDFCDSVHIEKCHVDYKNISSFITARELECIKYSILGKSSKEIGIILEISHRTVETHFLQVRIRFNIKKKSEFAELIFANTKLRLLCDF